MSHFYGTISGNGKDVSRGGTKDSGVRAEIKSMAHAARMSLRHEGGKDILTVSVDGVVIFTGYFKGNRDGVRQ